MVRRRAISLVVVFNLLFLASTTTAAAAAAAEPKPSCAACLSTSRAVDRALSKKTGEDSQQQQQQQQQQRRRGRSFPAFASEPAVASALLAEETCNEVGWPSVGPLSRFLLLPFSSFFFFPCSILFVGRENSLLK